jgi:chromosome partitioning protein
MKQKIITVTGYKGGVGKSTTAIHLAAYFSSRGQTVLIDGDPNRSDITMAARGGFPFELGPEKQLGKLIQGRDYIIIDTAARPQSGDLLELAKGCDLMILPLTPSMMTADPTLSLIEYLQTLKNVKAHYCALVTIIPPPPSRDGEAMREELKSAGIPVFESMIRRRSIYEKAVIKGKPLSMLTEAKAVLAWEEFVALGDEVEAML